MAIELYRIMSGGYDCRRKIANDEDVFGQAVAEP